MGLSSVGSIICLNTPRCFIICNLAELRIQYIVGEPRTHSVQSNCVVGHQSALAVVLSAGGEQAELIAVVVHLWTCAKQCIMCVETNETHSANAEFY